MRFTLFNSRKPKGFNFPARYYDADKEDLDRRVRLAQADLDRESAQNEVNLEATRARMRNEWKSMSKKSNSNSVALKRVVIAGVLFLFAYLFLFTNLLG